MCMLPHWLPSWGSHRGSLGYIIPGKVRGNLHRGQTPSPGAMPLHEVGVLHHRVGMSKFWVLLATRLVMADKQVKQQYLFRLQTNLVRQFAGCGHT